MAQFVKITIYQMFFQKLFWKGFRLYKKKESHCQSFQFRFTMIYSSEDNDDRDPARRVVASDQLIAITCYPRILTSSSYTRIPWSTLTRFLNERRETL